MRLKNLSISITSRDIPKHHGMSLDKTYHYSNKQSFAVQHCPASSIEKLIPVSKAILNFCLPASARVTAENVWIPGLVVLGCQAYDLIHKEAACSTARRWQLGY